MWPSGHTLQKVGGTKMRMMLRAFLGVLLIIGLPGTSEAATNLATMPAAEIETLQHRLADAGCYAGAIDGQATSATSEAVRACPDQSPVLRIETGMHTARVGRIGVDASCRLMVTGSHDKTVRLWALPDGTLQQTIRPPIGPDNGGQVFAVALSSNGRFLAFGGWDAALDKEQGMGLYFRDLVSHTTRRLGNFDNVMLYVTMSFDGTRVALGLHGTSGIRVVDVATGRELLADHNYGNDVYGLAFARDGSLYTSSYDGFLRRYDRNLRVTGKIRAPDGKQPQSVAVDPDGRRVAVSYNDTAAVSIFEAVSLNRLAKADSGDVTNGNLANLAWSSDGQRLVAGGTASIESSGQTFLRTFTATGQRVGSDVPVSNDTVVDIRPCGSGMAFAAGDTRFGMMSPNGQVRVLQAPITATMRDKLGTALTVSADAMKVRFGLDSGDSQPVLFDLKAGTLSDAPIVPSGLTPAKLDGLPIKNWNAGTGGPTLQGKPITLEANETSRSLAIRPDRSGFVLGTEWNLRAFDSSGNLRWIVHEPAIAWGVVISSYGRIIVTAYGDGTIRWQRWWDGQDLLSLFVHAPSRRWVAWTPSGYYMASSGAEDLIGWHLNRGWDQDADFFPASRFRDKFNRPDIVRLILDTLDEAAAEKQANAASKRHNDQKPLIERLPPVITILSPTEGSTAAPGVVQIRYRTRMPSGGAIDRVEAFVDGAKIKARGLGPSTSAPAPDEGTLLALPMPTHDAVISLVAYAGGQASDPARIQLKGASAAGPVGTDDALKPSLYALVIGVTHYNNSAYDLGFPAQDAQGIADAFMGQNGKLYKHVEVKLLTDETATALAVKEGLLWLQTQSTAHDLAIVFAAGHGMTDAKGKFWFLTADANPDKLLTTAVSKDDCDTPPLSAGSAWRPPRSAAPTGRSKPRSAAPP